MLLLRPDMDVLAGFMVFPDATTFYAIGSASAGPVGTAIVVLQLLETMAGHQRYGAAARAYAKAVNPDPIKVDSVHVESTALRVHFEWRGVQRTLVYFFRALGGDDWPAEIQSVEAVLDFGDGRETLDAFRDHLAPRLVRHAELYANTDIFKEHWLPYVPISLEAGPPVLVDRSWDDGGLFRFSCLRALLQPNQFSVADEMFLDI